METNLYDITSGFTKIRDDEKRNAVVFGLTDNDFEKLSDDFSDISTDVYKVVKYSKEKYEQLYDEELDIIKDIKYLLYVNSDMYEISRKKYMKGWWKMAVFNARKSSKYEQDVVDFKNNNPELYEKLQGNLTGRQRAFVEQNNDINLKFGEIYNGHSTKLTKQFYSDISRKEVT